jgi:CRISPR-associated endonuclease/helicase Cas3
MPHLAHRAADGREQTLAAHLLGVSARAQAHAAKLKLASAGALVGLLHDLGKATAEFQRYLGDPQNGIEPQDELRGTIDHSTAGGQIIRRELAHYRNPVVQELANLLFLVIASHHSGLIDAVKPSGEDNLQRRIDKPDAQTRTQEAWAALDDEVRARAEALLRDPDLLRSLERRVSSVLRSSDRPQPGDAEHLKLGLLVRMLFSCLIDADRTDTADFESQSAAAFRQAGSYLPWPVLQQRLDAVLTRFDSGSAMNELRQEVSEACFRAAERPQGTYTLTVPTGGGKTLAALRFALEHARRYELDRIVFVSPFISIVDQNAAVVRAILERPDDPPASLVLEHHSGLSFEGIPDGKGRTRERWRHKVLAENWDSPVVFTTMVQVLEAFFGGGTRPVRRLHALCKAVIVFDEAQVVPMRMLHLFNNAVNFLTEQCGSSVLLCTATQPELHTVHAERGAVHMAADSELMPDPATLSRLLQRYIVYDETARPGGWTPVDVADRAVALARDTGSCLVVVNTKADARSLFLLCRERMPGARLVHLSTAMCPEHRTEQLDQLKQWLKADMGSEDNPPVLCVSTQLIEAGVDIDFASVVRDLAGLDSLAQAAGRCNRHGTRKQMGHVLLVRLPDPPPALDDILRGRLTAERVLGEWRRAHPGEAFPLHDPAQMQTYFSYLLQERAKDMAYNVKPKDGGRADTLLSMLGKNELAVKDAFEERRPILRALLHQSFMKAAECFEVIAPTQGIIVPFREAGEKNVADLCAAHELAAEWQLLRKAQRYTISVLAHTFRRLEAEDAIYEAQGGTGVFCLRPEWYDLEFGLRDLPGLMEAQIA